MVTVAKTHVKDWLIFEALAELHVVQERLYSLEHKYGQTFETFEKSVEQGPEDFAKWDDYLEWKAYDSSLTDIQNRIEELKRDHFQLV